MSGIIPAALTLPASRLAHLNRDPSGSVPGRTAFDDDLRNNEQISELFLVTCENGIDRIRGNYLDLSFQTAADQLAVAGIFQRLEHFLAHNTESSPVFPLPGIINQ